MLPVRALLELVRFDRTVAASLYTLLGAYLAADAARLLSSEVARAALVVGLVVAFGFAINDCCDVEVDTLGRPGRPIPSGRVSRRFAIAFAWSLAAAALAVAATLGPWLALYAAGTLALSAAYSFRLKSTLLLGNAAMAVLVSAIPLFGALAAGGATVAVASAALMIFPFVFAQEVLYNIEDEEQDRRAGLKTTATRLGPAGALRVVRWLGAAFVAVAILPWALGLASDPYLFAILICSVLPTIAVLVVLSVRTNDLAIARSVTTTRLIWVSSVLPLVLLK
jgi:geranylgeranylglycerol-phosphate geranylgeranyltransferase